MELEDLKTAWKSLDDSLKKQELTNITILKDMLKSKSNKTLKRLLNYEILGIIACIVCLAKMYDIRESIPMKKFYPVNLTWYYCIVAFCIAGILSQLWKVKLLTNVCFKKPVSDNIKAVQQFKNWIHKEKVICLIIVIVLVFSFIILEGSRLNWLYFVLGMAVSAVITFWVYKKFYTDNINSVMESLEELEELEN